MKKQWYKLEDIADFTNIHNFFAAEGTPTFETNAQAIQLWSESQFEDVFDMNSEKSIYVAVTNDPWGSFKNKYTQWLNRNKNFIADELDALLRKYNPIYNYDRHEVYGGSDTVTNRQDHKITKEQPTAGTNKSTNWVIQSDTPQGGINNITGGSGSIDDTNVGQPPQSGNSTLYASAIQENTSYNEIDNGTTTEEYKSGVNGETQKTDFGHIIKNTGDEKTEGSQSDSSQTIDNEITSDSGSSTTSNTGNETRVNTGNDVTLNTGNETSVSNMGQINSSSNTGKSVTSGNETSVNTSKETKKANDNGISTTEYGKTLNQTGNDKENVTRVKGGNITKDSDNRHRIVYGSSDEYLKHLIGYMGVSQSKLLNEFRETFLNIDKMIIEDLRVLFFGLY